MLPLIVVFTSYILIYINGISIADPITDNYLYYSDFKGKPYTVESDTRSFILNGKRTLLLSGCIHYNRFSPYQWIDAMTKAKEDGLNTLQTYIFWNLHDQFYDFNGKHNYNYAGRANITAFLDVAKQVGLFVNLRIGPYVCSEWTFGGIPVWTLHDKDIIYRDNNDVWKKYMTQFVDEIANVIEPYLARNGGPIILSQIENEYHGEGESAYNYVQWAAGYAQSLNLEIPWMMCNGRSSNDNTTINTCNKGDCYGYAVAHKYAFPWNNQPISWTEDEGGLQIWSKGYNPNISNSDDRTPSDQSYVVALFVASGGSYHNYYMYYGGNNNLGNFAGSGIANEYADGVMIHSDGIPNEPKRSHIAKLQNILAQYQQPLLETDVQAGNEILLNRTDSNGGKLVASSIGMAAFLGRCFMNETYPDVMRWIFVSNGNQTGLIKLNDNSDFCLSGQENANSKAPPLLMKCNENDEYQNWYHNASSNQLKNMRTKSCLAVQVWSSLSVHWAASCSSDDTTTKWNLINVNNVNEQQGEQTMLISSQYYPYFCLIGVKYNGTFAYKYETKSGDQMVVFLANTEYNDYYLEWDDKQYFVPGLSVTIIDGKEGIELYNTAKVSTDGLPTKRVYNKVYDYKQLKYSYWTEIIPLTQQNMKKNNMTRNDNSTYNKTPFEQIRFTNYTDEYFVYYTNFSVESDNVQKFKNVTLSFKGTISNSYMIFIDDEYIGDAYNFDHGQGNLSHSVLIGDIRQGMHILSVISSSWGMHNIPENQKGPDHQDRKGICNVIAFKNSKNEIVFDLYENGWNHWIGLTGSNLQIYNDNNIWKPIKNINQIQNNSLTWYQTIFMTPNDDILSSGSLLLDIGTNGVNRGHIWINGNNLGHYNNINIEGYGMVQRYYLIPLDYLTNNENQLIFNEEIPNVNLSQIRIVTSTAIIP